MFTICWFTVLGAGEPNREDCIRWSVTLEDDHSTGLERCTDGGSRCCHNERLCGGFSPNGGRADAAGAVVSDAQLAHLRIWMHARM